MNINVKLMLYITYIIIIYIYIIMFGQQEIGQTGYVVTDFKGD